MIARRTQRGFEFVSDMENQTFSFFPSNARWLSPGRLSSRKDNCILQIHRIKAVATSVVTTKRTDWISHNPLADTCKNNSNKTKQSTQEKQSKNNKQNRARSVVSCSVHRHFGVPEEMTACITKGIGMAQITVNIWY